MGDEVEIGCDFVIMWWRLKVSGKGNFFEASQFANISTI